ncbi:hypothetical protein D3C87_1965530 [compost metagenome]
MTLVIKAFLHLQYAFAYKNGLKLDLLESSFLNGICQCSDIIKQRTAQTSPVCAFYKNLELRLPRTGLMAPDKGDQDLVIRGSMDNLVVPVGP